MSDTATAGTLPGLVYTFYSYKGGVGRSMALANVGVLMATEGRRVLLVDWDLEAPGLEVYFRNAAKLVGDPASTGGIVDLMEAHADGRSLTWRECLLKAEFVGHSLDIISAGRRSEDYRRRVQQLDWETLFREHRIGNFINKLRDEWRESYDFVLIDSRTGITDIGDICTVLLPDVLVLLFVCNYQNVEGIKDVMARAVRARSKLPINRNKLLGVPVAARDERDREYDKSLQWQQTFAKEFGDLYREWLPKDVLPSDALNRLFIPYVAAWSFGEPIPVLESERERSDPTSLGAAFARLATLLSNRLDWSAIDAKVTAVELAGTRLELSKARETARELEEQLVEVKQEAELAKTAASKVPMWSRLPTWGRVLLLIFGALFGSILYYIVVSPSEAQLITNLSDASPDVRAGAIQPLWKMTLGDNAKQATLAPRIGALLTDGSSKVRAEAATYIGSFDKHGAFAASVATLLTDNDPSVRVQAVNALGDMGPNAAKFAPEVAKLLSDESWLTRTWAIRTLGRMGPDTAAKFAPQIAARLDDSDEHVRKTAESTLRSLGPSGEQYLTGKQRTSTP